MSKFARMMDVLDLFSGQVTLMTAEDIAKRLNVSRPTAFRYARELSAAGLLANYSGSYSLGARIISLDYRIRDSDPVLRVARPVMREIASALTGTAVLCRMYNKDVINVHQEEAHNDGDAVYGRGRPLPLFRGAASKVMLAHLSRAKARRLYERHAAQADVQAIATTWEGFGSALRKIRQMGFYVSIGEVSPNTAGIAAPISLPKVGVIAVVSLVLPVERISLINPDEIGENLMSRSRDISRQLEVLMNATETPSRSRPASACVSH